MMRNKIAYLFPGQGAQYVGMGKDFVAQFPKAKQTLEEAEEILGKKLQKLIFEGSEKDLTETENSQVAIFVISMAILKVLEELFPEIRPSICAGLSLGEYTALAASKKLKFKDCLKIVHQRGQRMSEACEKNRGEMAVILGLNGEVVEQMVSDLDLPNDLWAANFNCPGQVVISGTSKGIRIGSEKAMALGAKKFLPLQVHGAFHSGLMREAEERLTPFIENLPLEKGESDLVMNVPGDFVEETAQIRKNLIRQVTSSVRWEQGIRSIERRGAVDYIEIGCGKTLAAMNRRIGVLGSTISLETIEQLKQIETYLGK